VATKAIRVLIVDDSSVMRRMVERSLREAGIEVGETLEAGDGWAALDVLKRQSPDLILCDINMPGMNGMEFLHILRDEHGSKNIPVVMVTTEGTQLRAAEAQAAGARGYIRKPFTSEQIRRQVLPLVEGK
jgi:two-component system chemotaxis response regulator CheY